MDILQMTVANILAIPEAMPERFFSSPDVVEHEYRIAAKKFHPDVAGGNTEAFKRLNALHDAARLRIRLGKWRVAFASLSSTSPTTPIVRSLADIEVADIVVESRVFDLSTHVRGTIMEVAVGSKRYAISSIIKIHWDNERELVLEIAEWKKQEDFSLLHRIALDQPGWTYVFREPRFSEKEIDAWCQETCTKRYTKLSHYGSLSDHFNMYSEITVMAFESKADAALFRLTWT